MKCVWIQKPKSVPSFMALSLFCASLFLILAFSPAVQASPGDLDPSFGTGGVVTTAVGIDNVGNSLAIQPDGKLVTAGYFFNGSQSVFALIRYNTDGSLDTAFGTGGIVSTAIHTLDDKAFDLIIQSDGKLVAAGYSYNGIQYEFALVRYNTDGSLDTTFGTGGIATTAIGTYDDVANSLAVQLDGKLIAGGFSYNGDQYKFALVRYNTDGSLDTTFGTEGIVTTAIGTSDDEANGLTIQSDGKLVAAGYSYNGDQYEFALVRYYTDGSLDTTFGTGGIVTTAIGTFNDRILALAIQSDGKLIAAGFSNNMDQDVFALVRYYTDGTVDTTFGSAGIVTTAIGNQGDRIFALAIQSDGKLVAAGFFATDFGPTMITLVRYNTDGSLDTTFDTGGIAITSIGSFSQAYALAIQADGRLVAAGISYDNQYYFTLSRYLVSETTTTTMTTSTTTTSTTTTSTTTTTTTIVATTTTTTSTTTTSRPTTTTTTNTTSTTRPTTTSTTTTTHPSTTTTTRSTTTTRPATTTTTTISTTSTTLSKGSRMTGNATIMIGDDKVKYGFLLHCDPKKSGNLQIKWTGNHFDLKKLTTAGCTDDPTILPNPARDRFDTHHGTGTGKYNGSSGATVEWTFTDAGKASADDRAAILIKDSNGNIVLSVSGTLNGGKNKTHK